MKYLKSCLPRRSLLDTTILLRSISFIEIGLLFGRTLYSSILVSSNFIIFNPFLYTVLTFLIILLIYDFLLFKI